MTAQFSYSSSIALSRRERVRAAACAIQRRRSRRAAQAGGAPVNQLESTPVEAVDGHVACVTLGIHEGPQAASHGARALPRVTHRAERPQPDQNANLGQVEGRLIA